MLSYDPKKEQDKTLIYEKPPGGTHIKRTGLLVGNFEKNPLQVPRSCFVGVA